MENLKKQYNKQKVQHTNIKIKTITNTNSRISQ